MKRLISLTILFSFAVYTFAQKDKGISKMNDCSLSNATRIEVINQRDAKDKADNYWATREVDFRVTNTCRCPIFIRLFEGLGSSSFLPAGISFRFDEKKRLWSHDFWGSKIPKFEDLELNGFDNYLLNPHQSFTFIDLLEAVPFELRQTFPFKIKYKRIIYISFDKSASEVKAIESPVFVVTNLK